jgi:hypothetical protein
MNNDEDWHDIAAERGDMARDRHIERNAQLHPPQLNNNMGQTKNYLNNLLCACAPDNQFAQDAIEHAIVCGNAPVTGFIESDIVNIMKHYDTHILNYRTAQAQARPLMEATMNFAAAAGLPVTAIHSHFKEAA